jgi:AcrR family transcriptional regulator
MSPAVALDAAAAVSGRSLATRAKLVRIAEQLFAERGVAAVSLNEISRAAGQRHSNVCQYHFGDRHGLIQAVIDKHVPGVVAARNAMFEQMAAEGRERLEDVVRAFVRPVAAKMRDPDGGVAFIRFSAQMIAANVQVLAGEGPYRFAIPEIESLSRRLQRALAGRGLPDDQLQARWTMAAIMLFQGLAVRSQLAGRSPHVASDLRRPPPSGEGDREAVEGAAAAFPLSRFATAAPEGEHLVSPRSYAIAHQVAGDGDDLDWFVVDLERMIVGALAAPADSEGA